MGNYENDAASRSIDESLRKLGTDYIDLMLLHQPFGDRYNAYRALEDALKGGQGESYRCEQFYPDHLIDLSHFVDVVPDSKPGGNTCILPADRGSQVYGRVGRSTHVVGTIG